MTVNVVQVREVDPPPDDEPVEWLLVTTLQIATAEQIREVIQYYAVRFMVEVLFRILKSGCRVEQRRFEHLCQQVSSVLAEAGLTAEELLATLPEARNRVYGRRYGKRRAGRASRRNPRGK